MLSSDAEGTKKLWGPMVMKADVFALGALLYCLKVGPHRCLYYNEEEFRSLYEALYKGKTLAVPILRRLAGFAKQSSKDCYQLLLALVQHHASRPALLPLSKTSGAIDWLDKVGGTEIAKPFRV